MDYPEWFVDFRAHQRVAIDRVVEEFDGGAQVVVLDAPTGSGKTLIAEAVRRALNAKRTMYVATTKSLQDQFVRDFPYAKVLKGRANYPTLLNRHATADDCMATHESPGCEWCGFKSRCPYEIAKKEALAADVAVVNTAYALTEWNGPGKCSGADLVVLDEADTLESALMSHVGLQISRERVSRLGLGEPERVTKQDSWVAWADDAIEQVRKKVAGLKKDESLVGIRRRKSLINLYAKLAKVRVGLDSGGWIYTGKGGSVSFKPVLVGEFGDLIWQHGKRFLLMSATIISPDELLESLGFEGRWSLVTVPSTFAPEQRPVKIIPAANMARSAGDGEKEKMANAITAILARHPGEKVLVHTVSYDLTRYLADSVRASGRESYSYASSADRERALQRFRDAANGAVLYAPSLDRGADLPDELCRVIIIAKVPFPYLGDRQVSARLYARGGQAWYTIQTVRTLVQMTGRGMRSVNDYCHAYILDACFGARVWSKGRNYFPAWYVDALDWRDRLDGRKAR